jgi:hypothetical protein
MALNEHEVVRAHSVPLSWVRSTDAPARGAEWKGGMQMSRKTWILLAAAGAVSLAPLTGCENLPGSKKEQGAVIGGVGGAAAGAAVAKENRILGALIGGALGAGGGYLIGAEMEKVKDNDREGATQAVQSAQNNPATPEQARQAATADVNNDGFVTLDEVVAMQRAGFDNAEMVRRLRATGQVFELTSDQEQYLRDRGVDVTVISAMRNMNQNTRTDAIGHR